MSQEHINTLSSVIMKPYQQKIIRFFKKMEDTTSKSPYLMSVEEALADLESK